MSVANTLIANKSCSIVVREQSARQIPMFRHPLAGVQLIKGTIEAGEEGWQAALRGLREEAGIGSAIHKKHLGTWSARFQDQVWSFHLCEVRCSLPDSWVHQTDDDGGHDFHFFWQPLYTAPPADCDEVFVGALAFVREALLPQDFLAADD